MFNFQRILPFLKKLARVRISILLILLLITAMGLVMLYSVSGKSLSPWVNRQLLHFLIAFGVMLITLMLPLRFWYSQAYGLYGFSLLTLLWVELSGFTGMGAQRWINLYFLKVQPSEFVKLTVILALARYLHDLPEGQIKKMKSLAVPLLLIFIPVGLVLRQPDLGTALILSMTGATMIFLAGIQMWKVYTVLGSVLTAVPALWPFLHAYQKERVLTFLNPERDPLGAGYHILQSKIAIGSGGLTGRGLAQGTQSQLSFLPEKHTDFIFTSLSEELGFLGAFILISLYAILFVYGYTVSFNSRIQFGRYLSFGIVTVSFLYVFINIAMVSGLLPIVGQPLPLMSYGGTSVLAFMFGFGLLFCADIHKDFRSRA